MPVRRYHPEIRARAAKSAKTFTIIEIPSEKPRRHDPEGIMKSRSFMEKRMVEAALGECLAVAFEVVRRNRRERHARAERRPG